MSNKIIEDLAYEYPTHVVRSSRGIQIFPEGRYIEIIPTNYAKPAYIWAEHEVDGEWDMIQPMDRQQIYRALQNLQGCGQVKSGYEIGLDTHTVTMEHSESGKPGQLELLVSFTEEGRMYSKEVRTLEKKYGPIAFSLGHVPYFSNVTRKNVAKDIRSWFSAHPTCFFKGKVSRLTTFNANLRAVVQIPLFDKFPHIVKPFSDLSVSKVKEVNKTVRQLPKRSLEIE